MYIKKGNKEEKTIAFSPQSEQKEPETTNNKSHSGSLTGSSGDYLKKPKNYSKTFENSTTEFYSPKFDISSQDTDSHFDGQFEFDINDSTMFGLLDFDDASTNNSKKSLSSSNPSLEENFETNQNFEFDEYNKMPYFNIQDPKDQHQQQVFSKSLDQSFLMDYNNKNNNETFKEDTTPFSSNINNITTFTEHPLGEHPSRTLFVRNISSNAEDEELKQLFQEFGEIRNMYTQCKHRGFVMVAYYDIRHSKAAMKNLQGKIIRKRKIDIHYSIPKDNPTEEDLNQGTLVVFNLDVSITNDELKVIFSKFGEVKEIRETPNKKHHKFVEFYDVRNADKAMKALNKIELKGKKIKIEPSRPGGVRKLSDFSPTFDNQQQQQQQQQQQYYHHNQQNHIQQQQDQDSIERSFNSPNNNNNNNNVNVNLSPLLNERKDDEKIRSKNRVNSNEDKKKISNGSW